MATATQKKLETAAATPEDRAIALVSDVFSGRFAPSRNGLPDERRVVDLEAVLEPLNDEQRNRFHLALAQFFSCARTELPNLITLSNMARKRLPSKPREVTAAERASAAGMTMSRAEIEERQAIERGVGRW